MKYWILGLVAFSLAACSPTNKSDENIDGSVWVQVPTTNGEKYSLNPVEVFTLKNLKKLSGLAAKFFVDPAVDKGELNGRSPDFRYIRNSGGVIVPTDSLSLQLATVYVHMEKLKALDEAAGAGDVNKWPRKVAVNAIYSSPTEGQLYNNALYSGQIDAMVFVPYTQNDLPVMVNAGVIGHEHFHSLFYKKVILPLGDKYPEAQKATVHNEQSRLKEMGLDNGSADAHGSDQESERELYQAVVLRGINEGLADVWGWIYSGDVDFVKRSIPQEKITRRIDLPLQRLSSKMEIRSYVNMYANSGQTMGISYSLGNQFARALKSLTDARAEKRQIETKDARAELAKIMVSALSVLKTKIENLAADETLSPAAVLEIFASQWAANNSLDAEICNQMIKMTPGQDKPDLVSCQKVLAQP